MAYYFIHSFYMSDDERAELFHRIQREGLYDVFFYNHQCRDVYEFLDYVKGPGTWVFKVTRDGDDIALGMLDGFSGKSARFHHCHFRWGWRHTRETANKTLHWLAEVLDGYIDTLVGITPAGNKLAVRYALKHGFEKLGTVPKALNTVWGIDDAVITTFNLESLRENLKE